MFKFSQKSLKNLEGVDSQLKLLATEVLKVSPFDISITSGYRTAEEQKAMFDKGASKCDGIKNKSKHQLGKAIDIMVFDENGKGTWNEKYYLQMAGVFKSTANRLNIKITWGGDFKSLVDMPHYELA